MLKKLDLTVDQVDFFEVNEAFAVVPMAAMRDIGIAHEKLNVLGGAVAIGHPIGASGVRVLATLINVLRKRGGRVGIASLCIGGGEGIAMAIELCRADRPVESSQSIGRKRLIRMVSAID